MFLTCRNVYKFLLQILSFRSTHVSRVELTITMHLVSLFEIDASANAATELVLTHTPCIGFALALSTSLEHTRVTLVASPHVSTAKCIAMAWLPDRSWALRVLRRARAGLTQAPAIFLPGSGPYGEVRWADSVTREGYCQVYASKGWCLAPLYAKSHTPHSLRGKWRTEACGAFHDAVIKEQNAWERDQMLAQILRARCGLGRSDASGYVYPYGQELDL